MPLSKIVGRTLDFLELFADQKRPLSVSETARLLDLPASSSHDVLKTLQERGYLYELTVRGGYYPTLRLYNIAKTIADHDPVVLRAGGVLTSLRDKIDEAILLSKVNGLSASYLLVLDSSHMLGFRARVGYPLRNLYATSTGKAILAGLGDAELGAFLKNTTLTPMTRKTNTSKTALRAELVEGNRRGWFLNREESEEGVTTLSARFKWISATYVVTIAGPTSRMAGKLKEAADLLTGVCRLLEVSPVPTVEER